MNSFQYRDNQLYAEDVSLAAIAEEFGTPCYVYSRRKLEEQFLAYQDALTGRSHVIYYAVKANSNIAVLNVLAKLGAGFDIVSAGELERVIAAGGDPAKIVFSGVGKTAAEMKRALELGIHCFNVESRAELERLNNIASEFGKAATISLRVSPDVDAETHPYIATGLKDNKFGIDIDDAPAIYQLANSLPGIEVAGINYHIGSQITSLEPFIDALDRILSLVDTLADQGIAIEHLNLGGGLGVCYDKETPPAPAQYIDAILEKFGDRTLSLAFEPGRSICAEAGILLSRVEYLKLSDHRNFAIIDIAMNDLIRPALYQAWMKVSPVQIRGDDHFSANAREYDLVGPVCESADFIGKNRLLDIVEGDLLVVHCAGAYAFAMSSNYNSRNRAAEVMVDGDQAHLVRRRETSADQINLEKILDT